ncbi:hypothetical protein ACFV3O_26315, partial [Streptomyces albidoflavus]
HNPHLPRPPPTPRPPPPHPPTHPHTPTPPAALDRIADRMQAYAAAGVTTLTLSPAGFTLDERLAALRAGTEALERAGLA